MTTDYPPDTGYIVGRPFKTADGWTTVGEPAPEDVVNSANLYAFISSGMVFPYVPDKGYAYLPPHMFNAVRTYQEVNDIIAIGEAPIEMDWTPPKKLEEAQAAVDAENASRLANQVVGQVQAEVWTRKLEESQISPRPVELPREEIFTDAKKSEAEDAAEEPEETPTYTASDDDPVKPEFDDEELQKQYDEAAWEPKTEFVINVDSPAAVVAATERDVENQAGEDDEDEVEEGYASWTKAELQEELGNRELPTSGNKAELVSRLEEDDASE